MSRPGINHEVLLHNVVDNFLLDPTGRPYAHYRNRLATRPN